MTLLRCDHWDKVEANQLKPWDGANLISANGSPITVHGTVTVGLNFAGVNFPTQVVVVDGLTAEAILGLDFLEAHECTIQIQKKLLMLPKHNVSLPLRRAKATSTPSIASVRIQQTQHVPAQSEVEIMAQVDDFISGGEWIIEQDPQKPLSVMVARAVVTPMHGKFPIRILNLGDDSVDLHQGMKLAVAERLDQDSVAIKTVSPAAGGTSSTEDTNGLLSYLWETVEGNDTMGELDKNKLYHLLVAYRDVFAADKTDFGRTNQIQHQIETGGASPVRQRSRRIAPTQREETTKMLQDMLNKQIIQPSTSPWASPIVLVRKKDGTLRFCVDYRKLNALTRKDAYPLPRIDDALDTLAGSKWFTTLDLISGYWQVEMSDDDREKTAFCTPDGLFEFNVMPFGLCNAPATFQRLMDAVLAGLQWSSCLVYLDDVIIPGKDFEDHLQNIRVVLERLRQAGLKLHPTKCHFGKKQVTFLGHIVSEDGVATDPQKISKVASWPVPISQHKVRQFLGLASYYRKFIKGFATVAKPLHRLTEKTAVFKWTTDCQVAFEKLRQQLVSPPILAFPDYQKPFILDTDASNLGIGAVLSQVQDDGQERVIAYGSRVLSKAERRYCVTRRELLAVVYFLQHFRPYLLGRHFTLRTDHGSLTWLRNFKEPEGQLARWLEKLQEYDFTIVHRPGQRHSNADALSRLPCQQCGRKLEEVTTQVRIITGNVHTLVGRPLQELRDLQLSDSHIGPVLKDLEQQKTPDTVNTRSQPPHTRRLIQQWRQLLVKDGVMWRQFQNTDGTPEILQLVIPQCLREEVLQELHSGLVGGHLGEDKMMARLRERFYWPGQWADVRNFCRACTSCATRKTPAPRRRAPLGTIRAGYPMQIIAVDILGPLPESTNGNSYILVVGDYFTRWMEAYAIRNQEATTVAQKLVDEIFCRFSTPEQLHSDQGSQFESQLIAEVCKLMNIHKSRTTPYHPQGDGLVERFNRTLLDMLATTSHNHPLDWEDHIRKVCMAYNTSEQATTGYSPFYLMFGRNARLPVDIMFPTEKPAADHVTYGEYAKTMKETMEKAFHTVRDHVGDKQERQKQFYDKKCHGQPFQTGDLVWLHSTVIPRGQAKKLYHPWTGPWKVVKPLSEAVYRIKGPSGSKQRRMIVHFDRLKPCQKGTEFVTLQSRTPVSKNTDSMTKELNSNGLKPNQFVAERIDDDDDADVPAGEITTAMPSPRYPPRVRQAPSRYNDYVPLT